MKTMSTEKINTKKKKSTFCHLLVETGIMAVGDELANPNFTNIL